MQIVVTADEMRAIDQRAIEKHGIPGLVLMENAGRCVADLLREKFPGLREKKVVVFAGKGNNGGDGFVVARHLFNRDVSVRVYLLGRHSQLRGDARTNAGIARNLGVPIQEIDEKSLNSIQHNLGHCHVVVDAIFGTGLTQPAEGLYGKAIQKINSANKYVVAIDVPSGTGSDGGQPMGPRVKANLTVALGLLKRSHLLYPSAETMGEVRLADIGLPKMAIDEQNVKLFLTQEDDVRAFFKRRHPDSHKGTYGHALAVAGSSGKGGAAGLTALGALRAGAGLVTLAWPKSCHASMQSVPLEAMTLPLPETERGTIAPSAKDVLLEQLAGKTALALGPGISTDDAVARFVNEFLPAVKCPMVVDADGLNCLAHCEGLLARLQAPAILTPHPREMSRISGESVEDILADRIGAATRFAVKHGVALVLKGARTVSAFPDGTAYINPTGNPGMATGGTGDALTGIIAGLLAQGFDVKSAALAGVYIHGLAGDMYAGENSETSLIAGDLLRTLPASLKRILP